MGLYKYDHVNANNWTLKTLESFMTHFQESNAIIDYLKFDIESSDFPALESMLSSGVLSRVRQMGLEVHIGGGDTRSLLGYYNLLKQLEDQGMLRWYFMMNYYNMRQTKNGFRSCCYEMVYINTRFITGFKV